jgi:clan AA aspartic protease
MMPGFVNQNCEAMMPIVIGRDNKPTQMIDALVDTGFTGFLSLPSSMIESLGLPWIFSDAVTLGDGSEVIFQMYRATVIWDGQFKVVDVAASESEPLLGISLLYGFKLQVEVIERGTVTIEAMTSFSRS